MTPEFLALQAAVAGRYSLDSELGRGGMGVVFLARDVALDRLVAIKLLPPLLAARSDLRARFLREARTAARLSHPHIVPIHSVEERQDLVFFVMGFVDGETAGARVRRAGPMPAREVAQVVQEVAWALGHAHSHGIIHRDVKPDNILLERGSGRAMVTDFGIAGAMTADGMSSGATGTPQYMAPEQATDGPIDGRADLYALGVTAYFLLNGTLPFQSDTVAGYLSKHANESAPKLLSVNPRLSPGLAGILDRLLEKEPARRFPSAEALVEAVRGTRGTQPEIAAPLRGFIREVEGAGGEMGFLLAVGGGAMAINWVLFRGDLFADLVFIPVSVLMLGLAGVRLGQVIGRTRDLIREGYTHSHLRPALAMDAERRGEEMGLAQARKATWRETMLITVVGAAKTGILGWLAQADVPVWLNFIGAVGAIIIPAVAVRRIWSFWRRGKKPLWLGLLGKKLGRWLFQVSGLGLRKPRTSPVSSELTEVALGSELHELFQRLPAATRRRFAELPALVDRLQADAQVIRIQAVGTSDGRLGQAVAALESIRLDLLRLHAGSIVDDELTRDLDAARRIGHQVDGALELESSLP